MSLSEWTPASHPDELTPATLRRLRLWRAMSDLSKAQADGRLSAEQTQLIESLADSLQQLATHLSQLADLGKQYVEALEPAVESISQLPAADVASPSQPVDL
jgi:hypothetical protein